MPETTVNGWSAWGHHVLEELKRLNECIDRLEKGQKAEREDIIVLKVKSGLYGAGSGGVLIGIVELIKLIT